MKAAVIAGAVALVVGTAAGLGAGAYAVRTWAPPAQVKVIEREGVERTRSLDPLSYVLGQNAANADKESPGKPTKAAEETPQQDRRPTPEEAATRWKQEFAASIAELQSEPRDARWASPTERAFRQDFSEQAQAFQAKLVNVDCRSSGCLARVEWDSYASAMSKFTDIPHHNYSTNCAVSLEVGDRPADPNRPHQATVLFRCVQDGVRAGEKG